MLPGRPLHSLVSVAAAAAAAALNRMQHLTKETVQTKADGEITWKRP